MAVESSGDMCALPEDCITTVLSLTSPKDACRLSAVASTFRSASLSDTVWNRFLPSDYRDIITRAVDPGDSLLPKFHSKKELYLHLCDHPILIDEGLKSFSLEKLSGKKCYMLAARDVTIEWGNTPQYWQWINLSESRFPEVAELLDISWLEIYGKINVNMLSSGTNYAAYLVFSSNLGTYYGFDYKPAEAFVGISGRECENRMVCLDPKLEQDGMDQNTEYPKQRNDGWMEVELGEYFVKGGEDGNFEVSLMEMNSGHWKGSLIIQGIEIRPKE